MKAILFDLDGTLGNTLPLCVAAFKEAIEPLAGRQFSDAEIFATFGPSEEGTIAALLPEKQEEGFHRYLERYAALHAEWPKPFTGIPDVLTYLRTKPVFVGLITGKGSRSAAITLRTYGLDDYFEVVKTGAPSGPVKDVRIEEVIDEHAFERETILYVGDTPADIAACRSCGIRSAAAAWAPTADRQALTSGRPDFLFTEVDAFLLFLKELYGDEPAKQPGLGAAT